MVLCDKLFGGQGEHRPLTSLITCRELWFTMDSSQRLHPSASHLHKQLCKQNKCVQYAAA